MSFEGITQGGAVPPDTNGAPGVNQQYVQTTNFLYAVFDKATDNITFGPYYVKSLFQGFGGQCETEDAMSDPTVRFDRAAGRWIIQQIAGEYGFTPPLFICIAVSTTSDATGSYYRYAIPYNNFLPDYPKLAVWPDAYYLTTDLYLNWNFQATSACALAAARCCKAARPRPSVSKLAVMFFISCLPIWMALCRHREEHLISSSATSAVPAMR